MLKFFTFFKFFKLILLILLVNGLNACSDNPDSTENTQNNQNQNNINQDNIPKKKRICEIDDNSIAGIPLGTTLTEVRQVFPQATITPMKDSDGVAFSSIKISPQIEVFAYTEDDKNQDSPISYLDTMSAVCETDVGVHPEMLVKEAEKSYGIVEQVVLEKRNGAQTAEFVAQPPELSFMIDKTGIFDDRDRVFPKITMAYQNHAKIERIAVMGLPEEETK